MTPENGSVADVESQLTNLLRFLCTEKSTAVNRMQTSFNWAFAVLTVFIVGVSSRPGFPGTYMSFFLLNVAFVMLCHFFVRTAKDYVNQIRFAALEKTCLACLFSLSIDGKTPQFTDVGKHFELYFVEWKSPKPLANVVRKTLFDHGYFILYAVVLTLLTWVGFKINWKDLRPFAILVGTGSVAIIMLRDFGGFYFKCAGEEESMRGKD